MSIYAEVFLSPHKKWGREDSCQKQKKLLKNSSFYIVIKVEQIPICSDAVCVHH